MMSLRMRAARLLLRTSTFIRSLPVVIMKPDDLVEFSRRTYSRPNDVDGWAESSLVDTGLRSDEIELIAAVPEKSGDLLVLGVGGGREAIVFAQTGFRVTGIDFVPELVDRALANAIERGVEIKGLVQEISQLDVPADSFDVVWLSRAMYSSVPTRSRRVAMVRKIAHSLKPGGYFICQFHQQPGVHPSAKGVFARRLLACLVWGNRSYEPGDILWQDIEFIHAFRSDAEVRAELQEAGLQVVDIVKSVNEIQRAVICRKQ
ncbi:MAG TPA: class I SAM-dependent methyltransferase [bacterium]|nr:class I SAM-dependent methyltransferase [bacterium]HPG45748.1 class I SAM-dependent methyltransferase [bacterium]HPM98025.1 class I SAM-dependent methyltransferase [bacterium]